MSEPLEKHQVHYLDGKPVNPFPPLTARADAFDLGVKAADSVLEDAALPEAVIDAVAESLGDAYDCGRGWSAWSYGTMGPDDFSMVAEDGDRVAEIATAAIEAYRAAMAAKKGGEA